MQTGGCEHILSAMVYLSPIQQREAVEILLGSLSLNEIMHRLIEFIKRIYVLVLFLILEVVALWSYATSSPYTEARILSRTTAAGGAISSVVTNVGHFFGLPAENRALVARVAELSEQLAERDRVLAEAGLDSTSMASYLDEEQHFRYHPARVVSMTTNHRRNFLILDRGMEHGIAKDMGVITPERELVGYVVSCAERYCVVQPMLNTEFSTGGRLVDNGHVCVVRWPGASKYELEAVELSVYSEPKKGMEVEVRSERLPDGILIGTIDSYSLNSAKSAYSATITIAAEMSALDNLLIVENRHYGEIEGLIEQVEE